MRLVLLPMMLLIGCPEPLGPLDNDPTESDVEVEVVDADDDGYAAELDCNDEDAAVHPGADEICNDIDDNCNDKIDEEDPWLLEVDVYYADVDADGYGDADAEVASCSPLEGYVTDATDCDDSSALFHPGAVEDDCADPNDYNCDGSVMYADEDADGFAACEDCDDADDGINDAAPEVCDTVDNDCDGLIDDADDSVTDPSTFYADDDGDGYGDATATALACEQPEGFTTDATDCDDAASATFPGAAETCDGIDNDCDSRVDDDDSDLVDGDTFYRDADGDGYGNSRLDVTACETPSGYVSDATDCDDSFADAYPGGDEICDGLDNDCDGATDDDDDDVSGLLEWFVDADGDGYGSDDEPAVEACAAPSGEVANDEDCDDTDDWIHPGIDFDFADGIDNDCDGDQDEDVGLETIDYDTDIQAIFDSSCTSCHSESSASGDLVLEDAYGQIVGVASADVATLDLVYPGRPDESYLWHKLRGTHVSVGGAGSAMPISGSLSAEDEEAIETWILEGAVE